MDQQKSASNLNYASIDEQLSHESWAMTLAALDQLDQGVSVFDEQLRLVGWNKHYLGLLDFPPALARVGTPFEDFIRYNAERGEYGPGDPESLTQQRVEAAKRFEPHCFERTRPNGRILEIRGNRLPGGGFVTVYTDITERKRVESALKHNHNMLEMRVAERTAQLQKLNRQLTEEVTKRKRIAAALWESEHWMRLIMDAIPARIAYVGADLCYAFANQKHEQLYGIPAEDFIGRSVGEVVGSIPSDLHQAHINKAMQGETTTFEYEFTNDHNQHFYMRTTYLPHISAQGEILGFFILGEDLSDYKQTQMALSQARKMDAIGQLSGGIAHDFNNLLTIIMGNLAFLEDDPELTEDVQSAVRTALDAAQRGADLTGRLLAFSRRQTLRPRVIELPRLIADVRQFLQRTLGTPISIQINVQDDVWNILADPNELSNALLNLAINARDAMPSGGTLIIAAENQIINSNAVQHMGADVQTGDYVLLSVTDNGSGMEAKTIEQAFEPFFTTKPSGVGTGLGLSMVYGFIKQSGGHAQIASQLGEGTTVKLYLPRALAAVEVEEGCTQAVDRSHDRVCVLVVEDEPEVRRLIRRSLTSVGHTVLEADTVQQARGVIQNQASIDLVLTDIVMPGEHSGWDLIREVEQQYPRIKCLAMSGYAEAAKDKSVMPAELNQQLRLLRKPFTQEDLLAMVRMVLQQSADDR